MRLSFFTILYLSLFLGSGPVFACDFGQDETAETMDISDPAKPISVSPGESFTIVLESNPTTGFSWQLDSPLDESVVKFSESRYVWPESDLDGAPGKEVWTFTALNHGKATISMKYSRSWEKNKPPAKTVVFTVVVK